MKTEVGHGYVYIYFSNENETFVEVYFDDFSVTHTPTNIVQYNEYYPFGLQTANSWSREEVMPNAFLYNGGSELNSVTNNYEMFFREYDPTLGRMNAIDPMASKYASLSPYNYAFNDPVYFNDPSGADPNDWNFIKESRNADYRHNYNLSRGIIGDDDLMNPFGDSFDIFGIGAWSGPSAEAVAFAKEKNGEIAYGLTRFGTMGMWVTYGNIVDTDPFERISFYDETRGGVLMEKTVVEMARHFGFSQIRDKGTCSTCLNPPTSAVSFSVGVASLALDFKSSITNPTIYTDVNGKTGTVFQTNRNGNLVMKSGKPVLKSANAAKHFNSATSLGTWGTLFNLAGAYLSFKSARESGWQSKQTSDLAAGLVSFVPGGGWVFSSLYSGIQSSNDLVKQGVPMQYVPMSIVGGLGPSPVIRN